MAVVKNLLFRHRLFLSVLLLVVLSLIYLLRSFFGFDWSDEAYYCAVSNRFLTGDMLFENAWDIHQSGALITLPLLAFYHLLNRGSNDGILLLFRLVFIAAQSLTAFNMFHVLRKRYRITTAFTAAAVYLSFAPFCINSFSYNTLSLLFLTLSVLLIYHSGTLHRFARTKHFLSGFAFALAVQAYPFVLLTALAFIGYYFIKRSTVNKNRLYLFWAGGALTVCLCFALFVYVNSSFLALINNLPNLLSDPEHPFTGIPVLLRKLFTIALDIFGYSLYGVVAVTLSALGCSFFRNNKTVAAFKYILYILCVLLYSILIYRILSDKALLTTTINLLTVPLTLIGPALYCLNNRKHDASVYLYLFGLLYSFSVLLGTNNKLYGSSYALILSAIAVILYCGNLTIPHNYKLFRSYAGKGVFFCLSASLLISIGFTRVTQVYRDLPLPYLVQRMDTGPAKGIYTSTESARKYDEIIYAIDLYVPAEGTVFYTALLPFGYLQKDLRPATPALWTTPLNSSRLSRYYALHPELRPDFVMVVNDGYGVHNGNNPFEGELAHYLSSGGFKKISLSCGTIYIKERPQAGSP